MYMTGSPVISISSRPTSPFNFFACPLILPFFIHNSFLQTIALLLMFHTSSSALKKKPLFSAYDEKLKKFFSFDIVDNFLLFDKESNPTGLRNMISFFLIFQMAVGAVNIRAGFLFL